jgi:NAD(P)-dependent dehydrogenase (short-subunit alcohol dehydrogenase family)
MSYERLSGVAEATEVADAVTWLSCSRSSYVVGAAVPVDRGSFAQ